MKRLTLFGVLCAGLMAAGAAAAQNPKALFDTCFARTYDAAHLARHPQQQVTSIRAEFLEFEDSLHARVFYDVRGKAEQRAFVGDCSKKIAGGFLCVRCDGDSCQHSKETFKILVKGRDTVEVVNDTTGVTVIFKAGDPPKKEKLAAGGEHRVFLLRRADATVCEEARNR